MINWEEILVKLNTKLKTQHDTIKVCLTELYIIECRRSGEICNLIRGELTSQTLREKLHELKIPLRGKGGPNNKRVFTLTKEEYESCSLQKLAVKKGVSRKTIYNKARELGFRKRG
jgi:hypothetical protein